MPAYSCGNGPSVQEPLLPSRSLRCWHLKMAMSRKESWITTLWRWSSYATCSSHPSTKWECSRAQIHEKALAARLSTVHNTAAAIFPFLIKQCVCWEHSWLWLIPAGFLGEACGWLSDHVYVTGYLGQITWDCFAWPVYKQHILLLPRQNKPDQSVVRNLRRCREEDQGTCSWMRAVSAS